MNDDFIFDNNNEPDNHHKDNSVDKLERDLYDPGVEHDQRGRRKIHERNIDLPKDFKTDKYEEVLSSHKKYELPHSLFKKIFLAAVGIFLLVLVAAGVSLYKTKQTISEDLIAFEVIAQPFVDGGEKLELQLRIQNFNNQILELPDVVVSYPKDSAPDSERVFLRRSLQNVGPGQRITQSFDVNLFGQEGDIRDIEATLEYRIAGSSSIFVKKANHQVIIRSTPTHISLEAPKEVVKNQEITLKFNVSSNSISQINNTLLKVQYPQGFEFIRSNVEPDFSNDTWYLDNVTNTEREFEIIGRLSALEGQGQTFVAEYGKQNQFNKNQIETVYNSLTHTVDVQKSFIEAGFRVNGKKDNRVSIRGGSDIDLNLSYKNTLPDALENVNLVVHLDGDLYDTQKVRVQNGFYDSLTKTIVFDRTTLEKLNLLQPGEEGELSFSLKAKDLVGKSEILSNSKIELKLDISGTQINGQKRSATSVARTTINANSDISILTKTQFSEGPFKNTGAMPPRVEMPTTYTMVFQVTNSSNKVKEAVLTTTLPQYVQWKYVVAPSVERNNISYDVDSRKVTWRLGELRSGLGVGNSLPRELSVQVELTPSASQLDKDVELSSDIILSGIDTFTGTELSFKKPPIRNRLDNSDEKGSGGVITQ